VEKQHQYKVLKQPASRVDQVNNLVHDDLMGPMMSKSLNDSRYVALFIDNMSKKSFVYFMQSKDEDLEKFKLYIA